DGAAVTTGGMGGRSRMANHRRSFLPVLAALTLLPVQDPIRDNRLLKSGIEVISVAATVRDSDGRLVTGLSRDAFEIFEDGERQAVTQFTSERVPIGLGVLLDISDSMYGRRIQDARAAVDRFLFDLLDPSDAFLM